MSESNNSHQPNHMELVGIIAAKWAYLEYYTDQAIYQLVGGYPDRVACLTANYPSIFPKLDALIALFHRHGADEKLLKKLTNFKNGLHETAKKRNRAIHDPWFLMKDGTTGNVDEGVVLPARKIGAGIRDREIEWGLRSPLGYNNRVFPGPADTEIFNKATDRHGRSPADDMEDEGVIWERADKSSGSRK